MSSKVYVVDTNIILQDIQNIFQISQDGSNIIVIPETVLLELEDKKKLFDEIGYQARAFARFLANAKLKEVDHNDNFKIAKVVNNNIAIHLISKEVYKTDIDTKHIAESNDKRIVEVAQVAQQYYKGQKTIFLSLDVYARIFASFHNIKTETLHDDKPEVPAFEFVKSMPLDSSLFNALEYKEIGEIDENHSANNFSYIFNSEDGNSAHGIVNNGHIDLLKETDFRGLKVKPVNLHQKFYMKAILSNYYDLVVVDAKAGSGKTLLAVACAMRLIDKSFYDKIVYVRNSIESLDKGADVGYLAGNDEKFRIYNMALYDTLEYIAKKMLKKSESRENPDAIMHKIDELTNKYRIEKLWPGEARGRTLSDSIVILDEWQNSSENTTQLILSRLDNTCMAIVIGSNRQIDNFYLNKFNNGLTSLLKETSKTHDDVKMFAIELQKAVRGKFAEFSERVFEKKRRR
jgi:PhoH-like ATPase